MTLQERRTGAAQSAKPAGPRSGGRILVDQLLVHGADMAFCVPGESYLEVLDALYDVRNRLTLINARHEAGAANMAEAYAKLTGKPGIAMVTRGPGACHASVGVHTAFQDSTPMILLVGQVGRGMMDREAFQESITAGCSGPCQVGGRNRRHRAHSRICGARLSSCTSGRPGRVALAARGHSERDRRGRRRRALCAARSRRRRRSTSRNCGKSLARRRPLLVVGGFGWSDEAAARSLAFAEAKRPARRVLVPPPGCVRQSLECFAATLSTRSRPRLTSA